MAKIADISLMDGKATPVAHTFGVKHCDNGLSVLEDRSGGIQIGYPRLTIETKESSQVRRIRIAVNVPVLEAVSGANPLGFAPAPRVAYETRAVVEIFAPTRGVVAERTDILAYIKSALNDTSILSVIKNGEEFY